MSNEVQAPQSPVPSSKTIRLHYLDWMRVLAILGVFLFHAVHPFDATDWHIKNAQQSLVVTLIFIVFLYPWGMPMFFMLAGAGSRFALLKRSARQYAAERTTRLFIPFLVGSILLSPLQLYLEWMHKAQTGLFAGSLLDFLLSRKVGPNPMVFGWAGYHLWFLGFLFAYALLGIPVFLWLKKSAGQRFVAWLARLSERRGGLLVFLIPLILVQILLRPWFPDEHHWADFFFTFVFFIAGYILYSDQRFEGAVRRDWPLMLTLGIISTLLFFAGAAAGVAIEWMSTPGIPQFYLGWALFSVNSWCWTIFVLYLGKRYLDFTNKWLQYGQQMIMPFFLVHQPVILGIAFFVVQWDISLLLKLLIVVIGSFAVSLGIYELILKRVGILRRLFGMKTSRQRKPPMVAD
ncbi:MAG: acyltransferase [Anaerolineales bacterium]|jgi:peptidoglycan/LPS O-acetylase OafA/YrhL